MEHQNRKAVREFTPQHASPRAIGASALRAAQNRNVMLTMRALVAASIKISKPPKVLKTCNIGTLTVPRDPYW